MHKSFKLSINYCGQYRFKYYDKNNIDKPCNENNHNIYSGNNLKIAKFFQPTSCDDSSKTFIELCKPTPAMKRRAKIYEFLFKYICIPTIIVGGIVTKINYDIEKRCREAHKYFF
ncbi:hypothetical protein G9C98_004717 [Cotesia typhae]|uniref:Uncharacterized protein n=1 Tax=Cotesia typhae TaxID=2053667 RepID=A0A8J5UQL4_9HYME|nr:hypothetical protein G9C98_004717 [Cotesia typhae]